MDPSSPAPVCSSDSCPKQISVSSAHLASFTETPFKKDQSGNGALQMSDDAGCQDQELRGSRSCGDGRDKSGWRRIVRNFTPS